MGVYNLNFPLSKAPHTFIYVVILICLFKAIFFQSPCNFFFQSFIIWENVFNFSCMCGFHQFSTAAGFQFHPLIWEDASLHADNPLSTHWHGFWGFCGSQKEPASCPWWQECCWHAGLQVSAGLLGFWFIVLSRPYIFLLVLCLAVTSVSESELLECIALHLELTVSFFHSATFILFVLKSTYVFVILLSSVQTCHLSIMQYS